MRKIKTLLFLIVFSTNFLQASEPPESNESCPVIILGGGIGAMTAAMYLGRAQAHPIVIEGKSPGGALIQSNSIRNWPGESDISGEALTEKVQNHAKESGAVFFQEEVIGIDLSKKPFTVTTREIYQKEKIHTRKTQSLIIAMGSSPNMLGVPGEAEYWSKGVYSCALCDGALYRNKVVAIIGGGDAAVTEGIYLSKIAKKVILLVRGGKLRAKDEAMKKELLSQPNIEIKMETSVKEIRGDGNQVTHLITQDKERLAVDAVFLAIGSTPNTALFRNRLSLDENGFIICNKKQETSVPGVLAIGDITSGFCKQAICAAGEGAAATVSIQNYCAAHADKVIQKTTELENKPVVVEITSLEQFQKEIKSGSQPVLVDFYATWCGPCKTFAPLFDSLARNFSNKIKFLKVNVDKAQELVSLYQIRTMPTLLVLNEKGQVIQRKIGTDEIFKFTSEIEKQHALPN